MHEHKLLVDLIQRINGYIDAETTASADAPYRNPARYYTDPELFEREKQVMFRGTPQLVCFSSDLPKSGDYRTFDDLGVPILITRDKAGKNEPVLINIHKNYRRQLGIPEDEPVAGEMFRRVFGADTA